MWPSVQDWVSALYIIVPTYCTNGAPIIFGGGGPVDFGKSLSDGERIFGEHKTVRGLVSGVIVGLVVASFEAYIFNPKLFLVAVLASIGAVLGDLAGAFIKRRLKIKPGGPLPFLDQLDFVLGAIIFVSTVAELSLGTVLIMLLVTPPIHVLTNVGAYALGLKATYW